MLPAPRTDPSERNYRTGLRPWVSGGKALVWVRVHVPDAEKVVGEAVKDNDRIYGLLKNSPSLPGSFNTPDDYIKAKAETDAYGAKATQAHRIIDTSLPRPRHAMARHGPRPATL